jgi:hypothetical protein
MMSVMRCVTSWAAILLLGAGSMGCGFYAAYCDEKMNCEGGNDNDTEACIIELDAEEERAENWGCEDIWLELFECREDRSVCDHPNRNYTTHDLCRFESDRYGDCMHGYAWWW